MQFNDHPTRFANSAWVVIPIVVVSVYGFISFYSFSSLLETNKWVEHTHEVISSATEIEKLVVDLETGERGFLITGKDVFLEPYEAANEKLQNKIGQTKLLVSDNPSQVAVIEKVEKLLSRWLNDVAKREIAVRREIAEGAIDSERLQGLLSAEANIINLNPIRENLRALHQMFMRAGNEDARIKVLAATKDILEMETAQRGFLLTGKDEFLEPYQAAANVLQAHVDQLHKIVDDGFDRMTMLNRIDALQEILKTNATPSGQVSDKVLSTIRLRSDEMMTQFGLANNDEAKFILLHILMMVSNNVDDFDHSGVGQLIQPDASGNFSQDQMFDALRDIVNRSFDVNQARRLITKVGNHADKWKEKTAAPEIAARRQMDKHRASFKDVVALIEMGTGKKIMSEIRSLLEQFKETEYRLMAVRKAEANRDTSISLWILAIGALILFSLVILVLRVSVRLNKNSRNLEVESVKLRESEMVSRNIVNTSLDSIITITPQGEIISCNTAVEKVFGYGNSELIGRNIKILMPTRYADAHDGYLTSHIKTGTKKSIWGGRELVGKRKSGEEFPIYISIGSVDTLNGKIFIGFIRDITQEKRFQDELQRVNEDLTSQNWLRSQVASITELTQGATDMQLMCDKVISKLADLIEAGHGVLYVSEATGEDDEELLSLMGSFAFKQRKNVVGAVKVGEGLVGQCAKEKKTIHLTEVPEDYIRISSALGEQAPLNIVAVPILFELQLVGVIELASFKAITEQQLEMVQLVTENIGVVLNNIRSMERTNALLRETQRQSEELQLRQDELRKSNENLQEQATLLKRSREELKQQSEELRVSNEELEEKQEVLKKQNQQVEDAKKDMEIKARELANASKYKSEFLANMSHELRTPLNSLLLLSKGLCANKEGNLTDSQVEDIQVIYEGGNDLLTLINDIMDLSKVEAGKLSIHFEEVHLEMLVRNIKKLFEPIAADRGISFDVIVDASAGDMLVSDGQRVEQILKNLLSNAMKFTEQGGVTLKIQQPERGIRFRQSKLRVESTLAFAVTDTGIGIPLEKQQAIFEAFQQQDGSTSRRYGGTGLGLTISRELSRLLGGEIHLQSREGEGSTFWLFLPKDGGAGHANPTLNEYRPVSVSEVQSHQPVGAVGQTSPPTAPTQPAPQIIADDRKIVSRDVKSLLIIEDDIKFATVLRDFARNNGYKCLVAGDGRSGIYLAMAYEPSGILLDMGLPDIKGSHVLEQLKFSLRTRHIPVQIISGYEEDKHNVLSQGAIGYLTKPVDEDQLKAVLTEIGGFAKTVIRKLLLVEDDQANQYAATQLLENAGVTIECVSNGKDACTEILSGVYDCVILDLQLPDMSGFDVLKHINEAEAVALPPIITYTGKELSDEEKTALDKYAATIVIKGAGSPERLLDDVSLFLHSIDASTQNGEASTISMLHDEDAMLQDRRVLLVDDDMRNAYALSKKLFEAGLQVDLANNGQEAVNILEKDDGYELVLMDIMMPVMDGYEAMRLIRQMPNYKDLPIIALTAKAMMEDREKCLEAGASEYLMKPIDYDKLQSLMRIWLFKRTG